MAGNDLQPPSSSGSPNQSPEQERIPIGYVSGVHGIAGGLKISSSTQPVERMLEYRPWDLARNGEWWRLELRSGRPYGKGLLVRLEGIEDRESARTWVGSEVAVSRAQLPVPDPDEYYWCDLIGTEVTDVHGAILGRVQSLMETGSNDVLVVHGERERLIPFIVGQVVKSVDLDNRRVTVDWDHEL